MEENSSAPPPPPSKPKYNPLPKIKGKRTVIDVPKIRQLFFDGPTPDLREFCKTHNYHWNLLKNRVPFARWRLEWIEAKIAEQNALAMPRAVEVRDFVIKKRLDTIKEDVDMADAMANIHRGLVAIYGKIMAAEMEALKANPNMIKGEILYERKVSTKRNVACDVYRSYRPPISVQEWRSLTEAYGRIQEIRHRALFINQSKDQIDERIKQLKEQATLDAENADQMVVIDEVVTIKNLGDAKPVDLEAAICKWFDRKVLDPALLNAPESPPSDPTPEDEGNV